MFIIAYTITMIGEHKYYEIFKGNNNICNVLKLEMF